MKNMQIAGTGNSRFLKSALTAATTWEEARSMLIAGTFPIDLAGINEAGVLTKGTPYDVDSVLIVGHNPTIEIAADALGNSSFGHFRPSEAALFTFDINEWRAIAPRACISNRFFAKPE